MFTALVPRPFQTMGPEFPRFSLGDSGWKDLRAFPSSQAQMPSLVILQWHSILYWG